MGGISTVSIMYTVAFAVCTPPQTTDALFTFRLLPEPVTVSGGTLQCVVCAADLGGAELALHHVVGQDLVQQRRIGFEPVDGGRIELAEGLIRRSEYRVLPAVEGVHQVHLRVEFARQGRGQHGQHRIVRRRHRNGIGRHPGHRSRSGRHLLRVGRAAGADQIGGGAGHRRRGGDHGETYGRGCRETDCRTSLFGFFAVSLHLRCS